jgi:hypothetical protein
MQAYILPRVGSNSQGSYSYKQKETTMNSDKYDLIFSLSAVVAVLIAVVAIIVAFTIGGISQGDRHERLQLACIEAQGSWVGSPVNECRF